METTEKPYHEFYGDLDVKLPIGYPVESSYTRELHLIAADTLSEEIYTKKLPGRPYTWIGQVITISTASIGNVTLPDQRDAFRKTKVLNIPQVVRDMPLADANTMLVEIHRRLWQNLMPKQTILCKFCSESLIADIDMNRIKLSPDSEALLADDKEFTSLFCDLPVAFSLAPIAGKIKTLVDNFPHTLTDKYNRLILSIPTLGMAIKNERLANDPLKLWKAIGFDCVVAIQKVEKGVVVSEFPAEYFPAISHVFYDCLGVGKNSAALRHVLQEELPNMPFDYEDECGCPKMRMIPFAMEASGFFST